MTYLKLSNKKLSLTIGEGINLINLDKDGKFVGFQNF